MEPLLTSQAAVIMALCTLLSLSNCGPLMSVAQSFDFFYFVQQWPGSFCDTRRGCCYPSTGTPAADFGIHGLWPNFNNGSYPSNCDRQSPFDPSTISDLRDDLEKEWPSLSCPSSDDTGFWSHEWTTHGTCSKSILDEHGYFQAAINLKTSVDLLQILKNAGIKPDGHLYNLRRIKAAIQEGTGFAPGIECNVDRSRHPQLYQIFMCVDSSATNFIDCPVLPKGKCPTEIEFPPFDDDEAAAVLPAVVNGAFDQE